jgi:hypothetical protein
MPDIANSDDECIHKVLISADSKNQSQLMNEYD